MCSYTSRARASRVTEVSIEGRTYKDKGEPIGRKPDHLAGTADCVISWKSLSLTFLNSRHLCLMLPLCLGLALVIFESWQSFVLAACLDVFFSLTFLFQLPLLMMALSLHPVCACHLWILPACFLLTAQEVGSWHTLLPWQFSFPTLFTAVFLLFPTLFSSYSLYFPTLFNYLLITSLLSWHPYFLNIFSLHISTL